MASDVDDFERSAQIVEAFMPGQTDEIAEILERIAQAICDRATDD